MTKYFAPLAVFVLGNFALLIAFVFLPAIGTGAEQLASDTANISSTFWGWTWVVGGTKLWVFLALEFAVLFGTAKAFLSVK